MLNTTIAPVKTSPQGIIKYPSRSEYYSAIRNPNFAFRKKDPRTHVERDLDSGLAVGHAIERIRPNGMREVWSASGGFAIAFKYETPAPKKLWAVRCFYRSSFEASRHYRRVITNLRKNSSCRTYFVGCDFFEEGIRVLGNYYPIVKMEWVEGENLKKFIKKNLGRWGALEQLANQWQELSRTLHAGGIAHGDLQHGNILVVPHFGGARLKLIDYDSLYFASEGAAIPDCVKGLADYQHPLRDALKKQCLAVDFFPQLVIYISILALAIKPQLWDTCGIEGREGLLFSKEDFQQPTRADIFRTLGRLPEPLPALARSLQNICQCREFSQIPPLERVLATVAETGSAFACESSRRLVPAIGHQGGNRRRPSLFAWLTRRSDRPAEAPPQDAPKAPDLKENETGDAVVPTMPETKAAPVVPTAAPSVAPGTPPATPKATAAPSVETPEIPPQSQTTDVRPVWDPRAYKKAMPAPPSAPRSVKAAAPSPPAEAHRQETSAPAGEAQEDEIFVWVERAEAKISQAYNDLKQKTARLLAPRTWTTREVTAHLGRPAAWCHRQRYKHPNTFLLGKHYTKDEDGIIHWTKPGIRQLRSLRRSEQKYAIPSSALATKEAAKHLGVPPEQLTKLKAKHKWQFKEGIHYYTDSQKRYHWTTEGIEQFKVLLARKAKDPSPTKKRKR